ncbi:MAG: hypothetical protein M0R80_03250 [Proteobacteria bacterium]|nr:hypothetical protein [Pseudomonadota bacterium]
MRSKGLTPEEIERTHGIPLPRKRILTTVKKVPIPPSTGKNMGSKIKRVTTVTTATAVAPIKLLPSKLTYDQLQYQKKMALLNPHRTCIINQFQGIGDILFCEPIARMHYKMGYRILWPVLPQFLTLSKHFDYITFIDKNLLNINYDDPNFNNIDGAFIIPLRFSDSIMGVPYKDCMKSKYMMFDLDFTTWRNTQWTRDINSEKELFYNVLGLSDNEPYNFISDVFRSDFSGKADIAITNNLRNIKLEKISDYSIIDWSMVIENATNIHIVGSAVSCIIEKLDIKAQKYHLYPRKPDEKDCANHEYFVEKPHITHT